MTQRLLAILLLLGASQLGAQSFTHFLSTDTIAYEIGDNIPVIQEWSYDGEANLDGPVLPPSLGKLEKISEEEPLLNEKDGRNIYRRRAVYTCFDTGYYQIPGIAWQVNGDSVVSNPLILQIHLVEIDTAQEIKDIEPPLTIPYTFKEIAPYLFGGLGILLVAVLVIVVLVRRSKRRGEVLRPKLPPYVVAYEKLEVLKTKGLWQQGEHKEYHFELSAILREYIHGKFNVAAQELTTDELYSLCEALKIEESLLQELFQAMRLGDLAKFAKAIPTNEQNEDAWKSVHNFVSKTHRDIIDTDD